MGITSLWTSECKNTISYNCKNYLVTKDRVIIMIRHLIVISLSFKTTAPTIEIWPRVSTNSLSRPRLILNSTTLTTTKIQVTISSSGAIPMLVVTHRCWPISPISKCSLNNRPKTMSPSLTLLIIRNKALKDHQGRQPMMKTSFKAH